MGKAIIGRTELRISTQDGHKEVCFWHDNQAFQALHLDGGCDYMMIGNYEESICASAMLEVVYSQKHPTIDYWGYGLSPAGGLILPYLVLKTKIAIRLMKNAAIDITRDLQAVGWDVHYSNILMPR